MKSKFTAKWFPCLPQVAGEALGLPSYGQPLRGQPIDMLPGIEAAALEVHVPAAAAPAQEAVLATAHSPRTPLPHTHTTGATCETDPVLSLLPKCASDLNTEHIIFKG